MEEAAEGAKVKAATEKTADKYTDSVSSDRTSSASTAASTAASTFARATTSARSVCQEHRKPLCQYRNTGIVVLYALDKSM